MEMLFLTNPMQRNYVGSGGRGCPILDAFSIAILVYYRTYLCNNDFFLGTTS